MSGVEPMAPAERGREAAPKTAPWQKLAMVAGGLLAAAVVLEVLLQIGGLFVDRDARTSPSSPGSSKLRIMTLGDSNTFGLYLDEEESYPHQLESLWNASGESPKIEVANLAYPGTNSVGLYSNYRRLLDSIQPDMVLVQIGANDFWTPPIELGKPDAGLLDFVRRHSRLYTLLYMLRRAYTEPPELEVDYDRSLLRFGAVKPGERPKAYLTADSGWARSGVIRYGSEEFQIQNPDHDVSTASKNAPDGATASTTLAKNLGQMLNDTDDRGVELAFLTYPSSRLYYGMANAIMRRVARARGASLIEIQKRFEKICRDEECAEYLFPDHHANAEGYRVIAKTVQHWLRANSDLARSAVQQEAPFPREEAR
jgi:lysophospholipase L1-like esterase